MKTERIRLRKLIKYPNSASRKRKITEIMKILRLMQETKDDDDIKGEKKKKILKANK